MYKSAQRHRTQSYFRDSDVQVVLIVESENMKKRRSRYPPVVHRVSRSRIFLVEFVKPYEQWNRHLWPSLERKAIWAPPGPVASLRVGFREGIVLAKGVSLTLEREAGRTPPGPVTGLRVSLGESRALVVGISLTLEWEADWAPPRPVAGLGVSLCGAPLGAVGTVWAEEVWRVAGVLSLVEAREVGEVRHIRGSSLCALHTLNALGAFGTGRLGGCLLGNRNGGTADGDRKDGRRNDGSEPHDDGSRET